MKRKMIIMALALVISILMLAGCTAAPQSGGQYGSNGQHGNSGNRAAEGIQQGGNGRQSAAVADADPANDTIIEENETQEPEPSVSDAAAAAANLSASADLAGYGSAGALSDSELNLADMLTYAMQDEYLAHAEYVSIIDAFGSVKPFSNIIKAEENHIAQLLPLFAAYGIAPPENSANAYIAAVADLTQAYSAGETAEVNNIAMYEAFLQNDLPDDIRTVFESLKSASENHLAAFRKHL